MGEFVYVIAEPDGEYAKVGVTQSPLVRLCTLQTGNPRRLSLIYQEELPTRDMAYQAEYRAHGAMLRWRLEGEWFKIPARYAEQEVKWACNFVRNTRQHPYYRDRLHLRSLGFDYQEMLDAELAAEAVAGDGTESE